MKISVEVPVVNLSEVLIYEKGIIVDFTGFGSVSCPDVAGLKPSCSHEHFNVPRIRLILEALFLVKADYPVQYSHFTVAVWCESEATFNLELKVFGKSFLIGDKSLSGTESCKVVAMDNNCYLKC